MNEMIGQSQTFNINNVAVEEVDGIEHRDAPDYSNAYISSAYWKDIKQDLTDHELDYLNDHFSDFVYAAVEDWIY